MANLASNQAVFSTLSRGTQQRLLAALGRPQELFLPEPTDEDEKADLQSDDRDRNFDSFRMIVIASRDSRPEQQQPTRVPAIDRSKLQRRGSVVDVFTPQSPKASPRPEASPRISSSPRVDSPRVSSSSPQPAPRPTSVVSPRPSPSPRPVSPPQRRVWFSGCCCCCCFFFCSSVICRRLLQRMQFPLRQSAMTARR
jgi:hypothetical protein